jgi:hypothetical protein
MQMRLTLGLTVLSTALMAGCGGERGVETGGGGSTTPPPVASGAGDAEGLWVGTTSTSRTMVGLVTSDGSYFVMYSGSGNAGTIAGVIQGSGVTSNGTFSSTNGRDFNLEGLGLIEATISATATANSTFDGSITYSTGTVTFKSTYDTSYDTTPTLARIVGTYQGELALASSVNDASLTIDANGNITGSTNGCAFTGRVTVRSDGNAYNLSLQNGTSTACTFPGQLFSGLAYLAPTSNVLYVVAPNASRTEGVLFVATKDTT